MILVGLTGGIGSGKSTVSAELVKLGAVIIDADATARELQQPGAPLFVAMIERFGTGIVTESGELDRAALAAMVFPNPELLAELNAITHPAIARALRDKMRRLVETDAVVVLDVPLLIESSRYPVGGVLVVDTPVDVAVDRLVRYRDMNEADARARVARQATREERLAKADFVIDNSKGRAHLVAQIPKAWKWINSLEHVAKDDRRLTDEVDTTPIPNHLA